MAKKKILFDSLIKRYDGNKYIKSGFECKSWSITHINEIKILNTTQKENIPFGIHEPYNLLADFTKKIKINYTIRLGNH